MLWMCTALLQSTFYYRGYNDISNTEDWTSGPGGSHDEDVVFQYPVRGGPSINKIMDKTQDRYWWPLILGTYRGLNFVILTQKHIKQLSRTTRWTGSKVPSLRYMGENVVADPRLRKGVVMTVNMPEDFKSDNKKTININQSWGAVILSRTEGKI